MLRKTVTSRWFALTDLLLVVVSGIAWILIPEVGMWFTLAALLPWGLRLLAMKLPIQRTPFDWLVVIFLITAWVGYWAAYDKTTAWTKAWLIVTSVLLYFALRSQPKENLLVLSSISFVAALSISVYYFIAHELAISGGGVAPWWMNNKLQANWPVIHREYISGSLTITSIFAVYWLWSVVTKSSSSFVTTLKLVLLLGTAMIVWAFILTMSRGIWAAVAGGFGAWMLWNITTSGRFMTGPRVRLLFPFMILIYLSLIIAFLYLGPARASGASPQSDFGKNTRAELFSRGLDLLEDYPITGGGLNSFPGLYSQYVLVIPSYYFINSYNTFLDIAIEQGLIGGLAILFLYFGSVWFVSRAVVKNQSPQMRFFNWLGLFALIVATLHGLFYDYLYTGGGTMLLLIPIGFSITGALNTDKAKIIQSPKALPTSYVRNVYVIIGTLVLGISTIFAIASNKIVSLWYANLGAVQMSKAELAAFPTNKWAEASILPNLERAESSFHTSLQFDPANRTANQRLGLISLLRRDFASASNYLEAAYEQMPTHRGVIKSLGYCYVWLGKYDDAWRLLDQIPEARHELSIYIGWWGTQGRPDLSEKATDMLVFIKLNEVDP